LWRSALDLAASVSRRVDEAPEVVATPVGDDRSTVGVSG
jgi:hypothetical protein